MNDFKLTYEKPSLQYWTTEELNSIEATMSGGGGSGTGYGFTYKWDTSPRTTTISSVDILTLGVEATISVVVGIATKNGELTVKIAGKLAKRIAKEIAESGANITYCKSMEYYLKAIPNNSAGVPMVCGTAQQTDYYSDEALTIPLSESTRYAQVSAGLEYMLDSCPIA